MGSPRPRSGRTLPLALSTLLLGCLACVLTQPTSACIRLRVTHPMTLQVRIHFNDKHASTSGFQQIRPRYTTIKQSIELTLALLDSSQAVLLLKVDGHVGDTVVFADDAQCAALVPLCKRILADSLCKMKLTVLSCSTHKDINRNSSTILSPQVISIILEPKFFLPQMRSNKSLFRGRCEGRKGGPFAICRPHKHQRASISQSRVSNDLTAFQIYGFFCWNTTLYNIIVHCILYTVYRILSYIVHCVQYTAV